MIFISEAFFVGIFRFTISAFEQLANTRAMGSFRQFAYSYNLTLNVSYFHISGYQSKIRDFHEQLPHVSLIPSFGNVVLCGCRATRDRGKAPSIVYDANATRVNCGFDSCTCALIRGSTRRPRRQTNAAVIVGCTWESGAG